MESGVLQLSALKDQSSPEAAAKSQEVQGLSMDALADLRDCIAQNSIDTKLITRYAFDDGSFDELGVQHTWGDPIVAAQLMYADLLMLHMSFADTDQPDRYDAPLSQVQELYRKLGLTWVPVTTRP